jgi:hypothetical protein
MPEVVFSNRKGRDPPDHRRERRDGIHAGAVTEARIGPQRLSPLRAEPLRTRDLGNHALPDTATSRSAIPAEQGAKRSTCV